MPMGSNILKAYLIQSQGAIDASLVSSGDKKYFFNLVKIIHEAAI